MHGEGQRRGGVTFPPRDKFRNAPTIIPGGILNVVARVRGAMSERAARKSDNTVITVISFRRIRDRTKPRLARRMKRGGGYTSTRDVSTKCITTFMYSRDSARFLSQKLLRARERAEPSPRSRASPLRPDRRDRHVDVLVNPGYHLLNLEHLPSRDLRQAQVSLDAPRA